MNTTVKKTITTKDLQKRLELGTVALFDVRGDAEYEKGHIPGSKTSPLGSLGFRVAHIMKPDSHVAVYSGGDDCSLAAQAAERLTNLGLRNVYCYEAGIEGWKAAGLPVVKSFKTKVYDQVPVIECRSIVVDRARAYGGVFAGDPVDVAGAGG